MPTGAEGYQEVSISGTETTYTDKAFLSSAFAGLMQASMWLVVVHTSDAHSLLRPRYTIGAPHQQADDHAHDLLDKPSWCQAP